MYKLPNAYAYALSDMRRITLVLMHILILPPSSYKTSFSYKASDDSETHDPSTHATWLVTSMVERLVDRLISRDQKARIYTDLSSICTSIFVCISISVCSSVCTDMSYSPDAYLHTPSAYRTNLSSEAHDACTHATRLLKEFRK